MSEDEDFMAYPEYEDPDFYKKIYVKKEFYETKSKPIEIDEKNLDNSVNKAMKKVCNPSSFNIQPYQAFVRNFISSTTNYNGLYLFWGVGTGKCITPETVVYVNGSLCKISDIWETFHQNDSDIDNEGGQWAQPSSQLIVNSISTGKIVENSVKRLYRQLISEVIRVVTLKNGRKIRLTKQHKLLTEKGWTNQLDDVKYVSVPHTIINTSNVQQIGGDLSFVLGKKIAKNKNDVIPACVINLPLEELRIVVKSYCDMGLFVDGYLELPQTRIENMDTLYHMFKLMGIEITISKNSGGFINCSIKPPEEDSMAHVVVTENSTIFVEIESIIEQPYSGFVYDLEIEEDHNYVAGGIICHNTCAAIQIAEGMKEMVQKLNKKIYVITKEPLRANFLKELYSVDETKHRPIPGTMVCAGDTYYIPPSDIADPDARGKKARTNIKKYYEFYGAQEFANEVDIRLRKNLPRGMSIGEYFSNSVFIIDEVHNLSRLDDDDTGMDSEEIKVKKQEKMQVKKQKAKQKKEKDGKPKLNKDGKPIAEREVSDRKAVEVLNEVFSTAEGIKLVLLSATPMRDTAEDLTVALNLLLLNDKKPIIDNAKLFPPRESEEVNEEYLKQITRGYISYVRGEDPISFPKIIEVNNEIKPNLSIYYPNPRFTLDESKERVHYISLVKCAMSTYQFYHYNHSTNVTKKETTDKKDTVTKNESLSLQSSIIVFPPVSDTQLSGDLCAERGFDNSFSKIKTTVGTTNKGTPRTITQFKYNPKCEGFLQLSKIGKYSKKLEIYLKNIISGKGTAYTYSGYVPCGARIIAMMLEENGYTRYNAHNLLHGKSRIRRCALCGDMENAHLTSKCSTFEPAKYIIFTGKYKPPQNDIDVFNHVSNIDGKEIKLIVGTRVSGEGVDFKMIREVHIIDPWHNNTRLYQAIGRAARHCSHKELPLKDRTVVVFRYCSSAPEISLDMSNIKDTDLDKVAVDKITYRELLTETVDEKVYRRVEKKEKFVKRVERILKVGAVDCSLNKNINVFHNALKNDTDGSRDCDYQKCDYVCDGFDGKAPEDKPQINNDTYGLYFSEHQITRIQQMIVELFRFNFVMELDNIIHEIKKDNPTIEQTFIYEALDKIIGKSPDKKPLMVKDRFDRQGHLIFSKTSEDHTSYYIFQPDELDDQTAPIYYKSTPLMIKKKGVTIKNVAPETKRHVATQDQPKARQEITVKIDIERKLEILSAITDKYVLQYTLDRYLPEEQKELYEYLYSYKSPKDSWSKLLEEMGDYYDSINMLYFTKITGHTRAIIGHHIGEKVRKISGGGWIDTTINDPAIVSTFAFIHSKDTRADGDIVGIVTYTDKGFIFKIKNHMTEKIQTRTDGEVSKKSKSTGRVCGTYKLPEHQEMGAIIGLDLTTSTVRADCCDKLEMKLRQMNDTKDLKYFEHK